MALEQYPYKNYRFKVEIDGVMVAGFNEISGFDATITVAEYREGDAAVNTPRKQPGLVKYTNITFKRGVIDENEFLPWVVDAFSGKLTRKTIVINLYDDADAIVASWQLINAWPARYAGPELNGMGSEVAVESIEFAHEGLSRLAV